jgi:hypothetical protein
VAALLPRRILVKYHMPAKGARKLDSKRLFVTDRRRLAVNPAGDHMANNAVCDPESCCWSGSIRPERAIYDRR